MVPSLKISSIPDGADRRRALSLFSSPPLLPTSFRSSKSHIGEHQLVRVPDSPDKASGVPADAVIFPPLPPVTQSSRTPTSTSKSLPPGSTRDLRIRDLPRPAPSPAPLKRGSTGFCRAAIAKIVGDGRHLSLSLSLSPSPTIDPRRRINKSHAAFCRATFGEGEDSLSLSLSFSLSRARALRFAVHRNPRRDVRACARAHPHVYAYACTAGTRETCVGGRVGRRARARARGCARYKRRPCPTGYTL